MFYWNLTYYPRCLILLARYGVPHNMTLRGALRDILRMEMRPRWIREG